MQRVEVVLALEHALDVDRPAVLDIVTDPNTANRPLGPKTSILEERDRTLSRDAGP